MHQQGVRGTIKPFGGWMLAASPRRLLDGQAAVKITAALDRMGRNILSSAKGVGGGVLGYRIDSGPGYRIYFGRDGDTMIVLLGGGTKRRQQRDIETARGFWRDYRRRKREE